MSTPNEIIQNFPTIAVADANSNITGINVSTSNSFATTAVNATFGNLVVTDSVTLPNSASYGNIIRVGNLEINGANTLQNNDITLTAISSESIVITSPNVVVTGDLFNLNSTLANLGPANSLAIPGGGNGTFLTSYANGVLTWAVPASSGGNGVPGGLPGAMQYNTGNGFGGPDSLLYSANYQSNTDAILINSGTLAIGNSSSNTIVSSSNVSQFVLPTPANLRIPGGNTGQILYATNTTGGVAWGNAPTGTPGGPQNSIQINDGSGNFFGTGNFQFIDNANSGVLTVGAGNAVTLAGNGVMTVSSGTNLTLPDVSNVKIGGGSNNFVLKTDGAGNLRWAVSTFYDTQQLSTAGPFTPDPLVNDMVVCSFNGNVSIVLPPASVEEVGAFLIVKDGLGANRINTPITISVQGGGLIDGLSNVQIDDAYNSLTIACINSTSWGRI